MSDLRTDPVWRATLCLPICLLLRKEYTEAEIGNLNISSAIAQNIVRLDIPVKDILAVHFEKAHRCLIQGVLAEFFRVNPVLLDDDIREGAVLHVLEEDPDTLIVVIEVNALDYLVAVEERDQT